MRGVMSKIRNYFLYFFLLVNYGLLAQKAEKAYERAEDLFYSEFLLEALYAYQDVLAIDPGYQDAVYKAEICSHLTIGRDNPLDKMLEYAETYGKKDKFFNYWMGRIYAQKYMFEEAKGAFELFLDRRGSKSKEIVSETKDFIAEAERRLSFFYNTDNYEIHQLDAPINTEGAELSPAFFKENDELLFMSSRNSGSKETFAVYHAIKENNRWTDVSEITILGQFNRETANLEVVNEDGRLFVFNPAKGGDLYFSESRNGQWVRPVEFDSKVTTTHLKSHFFINEHEDRIIFATSGKSKKDTDLDLYQTFKDAESGKWSKPAPFNLVINSDFDEDSPYLTPDEKTLYFASNGHGTIGGFDIFKSELDPETLTWSEPVNLGFPINSPDDELYFKMNPDGKGGYFSSNRLHTKGDFDIYLFWEIEKIKIEGRVYDLVAKQAIEEGVIRFTPSQYTDEHFKSELTAKGKYQTEIIADETYLVEVIKDGVTLFTDEFEIHETGGIQTTYIKDFLFGAGGKTTKPASDGVIASDNPKPQETKPQVTSPTVTQPQERKVEQKSTPVTNKPSNNSTANTPRTAKPSAIKDLPKSYSTGRKAILHNVYFDFGTSGLSQTSNPVLNELLEVLKSNPSLKVEIGGHTDNVGSTDVNEWLSQRRAETVRNWLIKRGIEPGRLVAKGYGEAYPIASNDDEKDGRELNRRIEIFVIQ